MPEQPKPKRCKTCIHCAKIGSAYQDPANVPFYCLAWPSKRTACGKKKIKANDPACPQHKERKK